MEKVWTVLIREVVNSGKDSKEAEIGKSEGGYGKLLRVLEVKVVA